MRIAYIGGMKDHPVFFSLSIYFAGCDAHPKCIGCHNPELHNPLNGFELTPQELCSIVVSKLEMLKFKTVAFVGGEPLAPYNRDGVRHVAKFLKAKFPDIVKILYSWRTPEDIANEELLEYVSDIDEFVLGRYDESQRTGTFPASANQLYIPRGRLIEYVSTIQTRERNQICG
jgi:anaerobic ribonucleoside-triphosphate reductase activating protein